ncbi:MAG: FAD-dependent oxidoreductase [Myxococcales bacterium]|nr:FAD-dependent oxidoreductase [Myxococcales bacterium]
MFRHLLSPTRIGRLELANRVAMAPMGVEIVEGDGKVREPVVRYYEERARGGVGLLITENTSACYPRGANSAHELGVSDDAFIPGLTSLTEAVHRTDSKIAIQLAHHGKVGRLDTLQGREILMPSIPRGHQGPRGPLDLSAEEMGLMARAAGGGPPKIREATGEDLEQLADDFASAAARAQTAGFDAVEIHGAHGYIFSEFLSPAWNFRSDDYGGGVENRARLLCEVLRACKLRTGGDFPIWCRIDAVEFSTQDGIDFEDTQRVAELLVEAGADALSVSAYANPLGAGFTEAPLVHAEGGFIDFAAGIKRRVDVPVIAAGRIEPRVGDDMIRDGRADVIAMGRKLLADPELVAKLVDGRPEDVRPCIYCYVCVAQPFFDRTVRCSVNPVAAREAELAERLRTRADSAKKVLVVGGGPAGMEAARVAALRGHDVALFEKSAQLGGSLRFAALSYEPNEHLLRWLETQVRKLPIALHLERTATPEAIREFAPDVVIAAVGALREPSDLPGADKPHVVDGDDLRAMLSGEGASRNGPSLPIFGKLAVAAGRLMGVTGDPAKLRRASKLYMPVGKRVVVIGGGLVGTELAEFFVERKRSVVVVHDGPIFAAEMAHPRRWRVLHELREAGARLVAEAQIEAIGDTAVRVRTTEGTQEVPADTVILATGLVANPHAIETIRSAGVPVVAVGDGNGVGYIEGAIQQGFEAALAL